MFLSLLVLEKMRFNFFYLTRLVGNNITCMQLYSNFILSLWLNHFIAKKVLQHNSLMVQPRLL